MTLKKSKGANEKSPRRRKRSFVRRGLNPRGEELFWGLILRDPLGEGGEELFALGAEDCLVRETHALSLLEVVLGGYGTADFPGLSQELFPEARGDSSENHLGLHPFQPHPYVFECLHDRLLLFCASHKVVEAHLVNTILDMGYLSTHYINFS